MKSNPAEDAQQIIDLISKHPVKAFFHVKNNIYDKMSNNASLMLKSLEGVIFGLYGLILSLLVFVLHIGLFVVSPISKLIWYVKMRNTIMRGEATFVEDKEDEG